MSGEGLVVYVQDVECSQCGAQPSEDCTGPGEGFHLSRFDRLQDVIDGVALATYTPTTQPRTPAGSTEEATS